MVKQCRRRKKNMAYICLHTVFQMLHVHVWNICQHWPYKCYNYPNVDTCIWVWGMTSQSFCWLQTASIFATFWAKVAIGCFSTCIHDILTDWQAQRENSFYLESVEKEDWAGWEKDFASLVRVFDARMRMSTEKE